MQRPPESCSKQHFLIPPPQIHLLRFILEAYEGIGLVTTLDSSLGLVELNIAPGCEQEVAQILVYEAEKLQLRPVSLKRKSSLTSTPQNSGDDSSDPP